MSDHASCVTFFFFFFDGTCMSLLTELGYRRGWKSKEAISWRGGALLQAELTPPEWLSIQMDSASSHYIWFCRFMICGGQSPHNVYNRQVWGEMWTGQEWNLGSSAYRRIAFIYHKAKPVHGMSDSFVDCSCRTWDQGSNPRLVSFRPSCANDANFRRSLTIDRLKSPKVDCSNPPQDRSPIKTTVLVVLCPTVCRVPETCLLLISNKIQASVQRKRQTCWPVHPDHRGTMIWLK